jgi:hypothetical protein
MLQQSHLTRAAGRPPGMAALRGAKERQEWEERRGAKGLGEGGGGRENAQDVVWPSI